MALRDHASIGEETKRKVWAAREELGYRVKTRSSGNIAFVLFDRGFEMPVYARFFQSIGEIATQQKMQPLYISLKNASFLEEKLPAALQARNVDGMIVSGLYGEDAHRRLQALGIPLVALGNYQLGVSPWSACEVDLAGGIRLMLSSLAERGHRRVGLVVGTSEKREYGQQIRQLYLNSLPGLGLVSVGIENDDGYGNHEQTEGVGMKEAVNALMRQPEPPTALLVEKANIFIYDALRELGLRFPEDVSVISLGKASYEMRPSLATVETNPEEMAKGAFEKLRRLIDSPDTPPTREIFFMDLIPGESLGPAPVR